VTTNELSEAMATTVIRVVDRDLAPVNNGEQEE
jgi:hypothetical protein